jgi:hypothetical protein
MNNANMSFKEEQERSVLSIFHQVKHQTFFLFGIFSLSVHLRFLFHLFYDVEKVM